MDSDELVFVGKIEKLIPIEGADFIVSAIVACGKGGTWRGIVRKCDFSDGDECLVFLPDSLLNAVDHAHLTFMKDSNWRVRMRRFKGAASEVLITKAWENLKFDSIGDDVTDQCKVTKYCKPVPAHLDGLIKGQFPWFIPKTDEPNYQSELELVESLVGRPYYITEKCDGSSTTAYRYKGEFGICSRNLELKRDENNGYWKVALKYRIEETLPEGYALQWETCGPGIQGNPMGLKDIDGFAFSAYDINAHCYLTGYELINLCKKLSFPMCKIVVWMQEFTNDGLDMLGEGIYANGKPREGVVVRSQDHFNGKPISFKVVNLNYDA